MRYLLKNESSLSPEISIVLLDWNVRESFHAIEYLNRQKTRRDIYEIIWVEYYDHIPKALSDLTDRYIQLGLPAPIDSWIVMGAPKDEIYHKHILYNIGMLNAKGRVVVIMDSDAIVKTTFVETIIKEFKENNNLVLHMEEIRNFNKKYYPFSYPAIEEILGPGCTMPYSVNIVEDGKSVDLGASLISLKEDWNLMHVYNYGACFCARREDIIRIGGSDEHQDYMGHICGPYEMTFRLINAGFNDKLHTKHFLYHVYHPSQGGDNNYCGPNNGRGMSLTAMEIPKSGRVLPLVENSEIRQLRLKL